MNGIPAEPVYDASEEVSSIRPCLDKSNMHGAPFGSFASFPYRRLDEDTYTFSANVWKRRKPKVIKSTASLDLTSHTRATSLNASPGAKSPAVYSALAQVRMKLIHATIVTADFRVPPAMALFGSRSTFVRVFEDQDVD